MTEGSLKGKEIQERMRKDQQHITLLEKDHKAPFFSRTKEETRKDFREMFGCPWTGFGCTSTKKLKNGYLHLNKTRRHFKRTMSAL